MRDVGLRVELGLAIDATLDLAGADGVHDRRNADEEIVLFFRVFQAVVERGGDFLESRFECCLGPHRALVAHEDADVIDLLPLVLQREQRADFEVPRGDVEPLGDLTPVVKVAEYLPVFVAVIDDEQLAPRDAGFLRHAMAPRSL